MLYFTGKVYFIKKRVVIVLTITEQQFVVIIYYRCRQKVRLVRGHILLVEHTSHIVKTYPTVVVHVGMQALLTG